MSSKLPPIHSVKIMGQTWTVVPTIQFKEDAAQMGSCEFEDREILVKSTMAIDAQVDTLFHEIVHAYQEINPMNMHFKSDDDKHEYFAQYTSALIVDLIRNNPDLINKILSTAQDKKSKGR